MVEARVASPGERASTTFITHERMAIYSGSQKSEVCPMPTEAYAHGGLCPMPMSTSSFARKAIPIPNYPSPILNFEYRKRQDYKKL